MKIINILFFPFILIYEIYKLAKISISKRYANYIYWKNNRTRKPEWITPVRKV